MLVKLACFLGTRQGFWAMMLLTMICVGGIVISEVFATLLLSILAIILPAIIMLVQTAHDKALHTKLDEILRAIPQADNRLRGIEKDVEQVSD